MVTSPQQEYFAPDGRANYLEDWSVEQSGSTWFLLLRCSPDTLRHILGAWPRAVPVRFLQERPYWTDRLRLDFLPHSELLDFLEFLKKVYILRITSKSSVDGAIAFDFYRKPSEQDVNRLLKTRVGDLVSKAKGYRNDPPDVVADATRILCKWTYLAVEKHSWLRSATRVLPVPGKNGYSPDDLSSQMAMAVSQAHDIRYVPVERKPGYHKSAKDMSRAERIEMKRAFRVREDLRDETVLIVDDVYQTGYTMGGVASAARQSGATTVLGLAAARNFRW